MTSSTTYLITGANRGIGLGLTAALLLRANTTVIATIRTLTTSTSDLTTLPIAPNSRLVIIPFTLSLSSPSAVSESLLSTLAENKITKIDTLILNAGLGSSFFPTLQTTLASLLEHFESNTLLPIAFFQTLYPLLSTPSKLILISSSLGSIKDMEGATPTLAYGVSKAGANYFVRKVHFEHAGVVALAVHPGWVKTANGQNFADSIGVAEPPMTLEQSVNGVLAQIDGATKETTSGSFVSFDGSTVEW
ncbi:NAD(P)-binding protein [Hyaloscypha variabilis F]|uniref:NAD(P)-binding protein n=1 Tax=Hyaloscypha variabilis (strain UAMH 11265 / GT02V1 / F) TaxID=1149755 RepID=A0A2J6RC07_HYAVF|nr:NAD(P)-binding protein [Hyaloscypha variabilis F]